MNLFREVRRRRSLSRENNNSERQQTQATPPSANGHASLRRSLLPRSRTASNDLASILKGGSAGGVDASTNEEKSSNNKEPPPSSSGTLSASATSATISKVTDWSYCRPPKKPPPSVEAPPRVRPRVPARSASLGRGQRKAGYTRSSSTVHNFEEADQLAQSHQLALEQKRQQQQEKHFSTFKQQDCCGGVRFRQADRSRRGGSSAVRPRSADLSSEASSSSSGATVTSSTKKRLPNSNSSEFFRVVQDRLAAIEAAAASATIGGGGGGGDAASRDYSSLESLLEDEDSCANIVTAMQYDSLELLDEAEEDALKRLMVAKTGCHVPLDALDNHQQENESSNSSANNSVSLSCSKNAQSTGSKYNSLPRSVIGSIQLKVQEIKGQIDVLKIPGQQQLQQQLQRQSSGVPKSALQLLGLNGIAGGSFQSPSSSHEAEADSTSPRSLSPAGGGGLNVGAGGSSNSVPHPRTNALPPHLAQAALAAAESSSPSTLSPCSSNSLSSSAASASAAANNNNGPARPQVLRLPQSSSFNTFGQLNSKAENQLQLGPLQQGSYTPSAGGSSQREKLVFFFDIINTQERIAKVRRPTATLRDTGTAKKLSVCNNVRGAH